MILIRDVLAGCIFQKQNNTKNVCIVVRVTCNVYSVHRLRVHVNIHHKVMFSIRKSASVQILVNISTRFNQLDKPTLCYVSMQYLYPVLYIVHMIKAKFWQQQKCNVPAKRGSTVGISSCPPPKKLIFISLSVFID